MQELTSKLFSVVDNHVHRKDRSRCGGGVLLACSQKISSIRRSELETDCEIMWCEIVISNPYSRIMVGVFYRPPSTDVSYLLELEKSLCLLERSGNTLTTLLLGDFNLPNIVWSNPSCPVGSDTLSSTFCSIFQDYFFHQMVLNPTRGNNILDLVLSTAPDLLFDLSVNEGLGSSDHSSIEFNLRLKILRPKQSPRIVYNFGSANWNNLQDDFSNIPWNTAFLMDDINDVWDAWKALFMEAVDRNIPTKSLKHKRNAPWFNSELRILVLKKRRLWRKAKSSRDPVKWAQYKSFSNKVKDSLNKAYRNYVANLTASLPSKPKKFWSFVKSRTGNASIPSCVQYDGQSAFTPKGKADLFNKFFHSVFSERFGEMAYEDFTPFTEDTVDVLLCSVADVYKVLSSLDVNKAIGPDAISPRILKECAAELAPSISQLFNFSLNHGKLPSVWKSANVVPIHKSGERTLAENYRPVSLTSILVKCLERIIHKHIMKF